MKETREEEYNRKFPELRTWPSCRADYPMLDPKDAYAGLLAVVSWMKGLSRPVLLLPDEPAWFRLVPVCVARSKVSPDGEAISWSTPVDVSWEYITDPKISAESIAKMVAETALEQYREWWGDE